MPATIAPCIIPVAGVPFVRPSMLGEGIRLFGASSGYVGFKPASAAGSTDYTLPSSPPSVDGQVLMGTTAGVLSWATISTGLTVGSTPITGGASGRILFESATGKVSESANLTWGSAGLSIGGGVAGGTGWKVGSNFNAHLATDKNIEFSLDGTISTIVADTDTGNSAIALALVGNPLYLNSSSGLTGITVLYAGTVGINKSSSHGAQLHVVAGSASTVGQRIDLASGQSANAIEVNSYGGSAGNLLSISSSGSVYAASSIQSATGSFTGAGSYTGMGLLAGSQGTSLYSGGSERLRVNNSDIVLFGSMKLGFGLTFTTDIDSGIARNSAGMLEVNNTTINQYRDLKLRSLYAVAGAATDIPINVSLASGQSANAIEVNSYGGSGGDCFSVRAGASPRVKVYGGIENYHGGVRMFYTHWDALTVRSDTIIGWAATTSVPQGSGDTGLARNSAGVVEVNNGTTGNYRDLKLRDLKCNSVTSTVLGGSTPLWTLDGTSGGSYGSSLTLYGRTGLDRGLKIASGGDGGNASISLLGGTSGLNLPDLAIGYKAADTWSFSTSSGIGLLGYGRNITPKIMPDLFVTDTAAQTVTIQGRSAYVSAVTNVNGGHVRIIPGEKTPASGGVSGNVILSHDGTTAIGGVLIGTSTAVEPCTVGLVTSFSKQAYCPQQTLTDAASIAWDLDTQPSAVVTLTDNRTLAAPTNQKAGATYILLVKQDATGSRTLTFNAVYKFSGGTAPTLTTTANAVDMLTFLSDGTYMYGVCQNDLR